MKRVVKKRNKQRTMKYKSMLVFVVIFVVYVASSTFLNNYNTALNHQLQNIKKENETMVNSNQTLKIKIDELSSFERMNSIAKKNGLENREGSIKNVE